MSRIRLLPLAACLLCAPSLNAQELSYGLTSRPVVGGYLNSALPPEPPAEPTDWSVIDAFPNLTFQNPMGLCALPGTNQLLVWEREGRVYLIDNDPATATKTLCLDLSNRCQGWDDCGLFSVCPHPDFANNRQLFVFYTYVTPGTVAGSATERPPGEPLISSTKDPRSRLSRFTLDASGIGVPGSEFALINQTIKNTWHKGGAMFFHPQSGLLYLSIGNDYNTANNQVINHELAAGILRIDVDKTGGAFSHPPPRQPDHGTSFTNGVPNYYIPNDNPFVGQAGVLEEFYALGLRSPHRMTIDPPTSRIHIGEVGGDVWEEVNIIDPADPAGLNFQWPLKEGNQGDLSGSFIGVSRSPLVSFPHAGGQSLPQMHSIIGGYVYRGARLAAQIGGKYICADNNTANIYSIDESTDPPAVTYLATLPRSQGPNTGEQYDSISSFGIDADNELYMTCLGANDGKIYKLSATGGTTGGDTPLPATLSQTGVFSDLATLTPNPALIPYTVNVPFWSDGALKSRWAAIPSDSTITFSPASAWKFPTGSVLVKHFGFPVDETNPGSVKRLETRLLVKTTTGVYGATYKWRDDNSNADLVDSSGLTEDIAVSTPESLGDLTSLDIGNPNLAGTITRNGDDLVITAGGIDIWGASDQFRFSYLQRAGDFDLRIRVDSITRADNLSKAGLMARASLAANSRYVQAVAYPTDGGRSYNSEFRLTDGGDADATPEVTPGTAFPRWLRLRRSGSVFTSFTGTDGETWTTIGSVTIDMPGTLYVGPAVCSLNASGTTEAHIHLERDTRLQPWYYPSHTDCLTCHNPPSGYVLGASTRQMNGSLAYPSTGVSDNQIRAWNHIGLFSNAPQESDIPALTKLVPASNNTASLEDRARSYLDANCSQCHRPGGVPANWDARYKTPLINQNIINGSVGNVLGQPGSKVVAPQDLLHSVLYSRLNRIGQDQMPPLARNTIDTAGVAMLADWINSLPAIDLAGPNDGDAYLDSDAITLDGNASAATGSVDHIEFWDNGVKIGQSATVPYQIVLPSPLSKGGHKIIAVVYDTSGRSSPSAPITINVLPLQLRITGFGGSGQPQLETQLPGGRRFVVETSDQPGGPWVPLQTGTADGDPMVIEDPTASGARRFYRLGVNP